MSVRRRAHGAERGWRALDKLVRVLRREPIVALVTLCLLNVFIVAAGTAVVLLTPKRELAVQPPAVAARQVVVPGGSGGGGGGGGWGGGRATAGRTPRAPA